LFVGLQTTDAYSKIKIPNKSNKCNKGLQKYVGISRNETSQNKFSIMESFGNNSKNMTMDRDRQTDKQTDRWTDVMDNGQHTLRCA